MKTKITLLTIAVVAGFYSTVYAGGNSVSIAVSCTVPEVPGMNVPLREVQKEAAQVALVKGADTKDSAKKVLVKTFYPR